MDEKAMREDQSKNGKVKRLIKPSLAITAAGATLVAGVKMRSKLNIDRFRERTLNRRGKTSSDSVVNDSSFNEEEE
jgi:hypothetical protein